MTATAAEYTASMRRWCDLVDGDPKVAKLVERTILLNPDLLMPIGHLDYCIDQAYADVTAAAKTAGLHVDPTDSYLMDGVAVNFGAIKLAVFSQARESVGAA